MRFRKLAGGAISLVESPIDWPLWQAKAFNLADEIAMDACGQFDRNLCGLIVDQRSQLQFWYLGHPRYGSRTRSPLTMARTGNPAWFSVG